MSSYLRNFLSIPTSDGHAVIRPSAINAVFAYDDGIDPTAKSWVKLTDNTQLKSTATVQEIRDLLNIKSS